jgi:hypothetical protein
MIYKVLKGLRFLETGKTYLPGAILPAGEVGAENVRRLLKKGYLLEMGAEAPKAGGPLPEPMKPEPGGKGRKGHDV